MRLRRTITIPTRYEDEDPRPPRARNGTRPAYPSLLRGQVIPFNPDHPPAQFPSLPLSSSRPSAHHLQPNIESIADPPSDLQEQPDSTVGDPVRDSKTKASVPRSSSSPTHSLVARSPDSSTDAIQEDLQVPVTATVYSDQLPRPNLDHSSALNTATVADGSVVSDTYRTEDAAMWNALPLSLQYHIFTSLARLHPTKHLVQLLGLTEEEFSQISRAASLREAHPASLADIWHSAWNGTAYVPGFTEDISIDAENFKEFADYMAFASSFEFAFQSEIRDAENYLCRRGMVCDLLGSWIPDPSEPQGSQYFVRLPSLATDPIPRSDSLLDSNDPPLPEVENEEVIAGSSSIHRSSPIDHTTVRKNISGKLIPRKGRVHSSAPIGSTSTRQRRYVASSLANPSKSARHPLANAALVPDSSSETIVDIGHSKSSEKLKSTALGQLSKEDVVPSTPDPSNLILKIQGKDGLARILKKKHRSTDNTLPLSAVQFEPAAQAPSVEAGHLDQENKSSLAKLDTSMSGFSKSLLMDRTIAESPVFDKQDSPTLESIQHAICPLQPESLPHKRKASRDARCTNSLKSPRTIGETPKTPPTSIVTHDINNEHLRHAEAKLSRQRCLSSSRNCRPADEPASTMPLASDDTLQLSSRASLTVAECLRSPSYSPISENEYLESYQALLRNPPRRLKISKAHWGAEAHTQLWENQSELSIGYTQDIPHDGNVSRAGLMSVVPLVKVKPDPRPSAAGAESAILEVPKKPKITLLCKNAKETSLSKVENSVRSGEETKAKTPSASSNSESDIVATPRGALKEDVEGEEATHSPAEQSQPKKTVPKRNTKVTSESICDERAQHIVRGSSTKSFVKTSEQNSNTTARETKESGSKRRGPGRPRGPRGPYRKTRERTAKEEQERQRMPQQAEQDESTPKKETIPQQHDHHGASMTNAEKKKKRQAMI
ncbi:hypothetical protein PV08_06032 [Exophiala spinifera]|uniref:Uncharacterized protein n=1 Tax=Exophiala spinifera TaxID=91928 RepID=A0A0D1YLT0_9EURO|nr:uncharacterized protein PV08_06032 [Exophiala spinifera]KIW15981.1 hypothetical protein PV08_06032 [Exophiala spinifera]